MKNLLILFVTTVVSAVAHAQSPVEVTTKLDQLNDTTYILSFTASIEKGWHVYSTNAGDGPSSTELIIETSQNCILFGDLEQQGDLISVFDNLFDTEVRYFENSIVFEQRIIAPANNFTIQGYLQYSACNETTCTPPTPVEFSFGSDIETSSAVQEELFRPISFEQSNPLSSLTDHDELWTPADNQSALIDVDNISLWFIFWSSFLSGLIALLTPCVWPIIPMTVSFFIKRSSSKSRSIVDALMYGASIIVIYVLLGLIVSVLFDANRLNAFSTNAIVNVFFTILLLVFGLSFLGAFDLSLPSSWSTTINTKAAKSGGLLSIFLMAFTLSLVSFSCTGPIVGFLLVQISTYGNIIAPAIGMLGFATALALPFTLFALFPSMLSSLPRSGNWMTTLKVMLGFIEIAFALKFFSVADLAYGWHLLDREIFIALWIALAIALALYLWRIVRLDHDAEGRSVRPLRCMLGIVVMSFAIYLMPGLWGAPLNAVSAFLPPMSTQDFNLNTNTVEAKFTTYEEGMLYAQTKGKKAVLDFTGFGCVNCREMEQKVWTNNEVAHALTNDFVLISLYTDDKTPLPQRIEIEENGQKTTLRTIGDKWSYLQRRRFGVNAQPFYVVVEANGTLISEPQTFTTDPNVFLSFLNSSK